MWLTLTALLIGAVQGQDDARAIFGRMEAQLLKCKALRVEVDIAIAPGKDKSAKGTLVVAKDNKMRLMLAANFGAKASKLLIVSDGIKLSSSGVSDKDTVQNTPKELSKTVLQAFAKGGIFPSFFMVGQEQSVAGFKVGKKEMVAGKEAQAVEYQLTGVSPLQPTRKREPGGKQETYPVTVWIDVKTNLPLKRLVTFKERQDSFTITETYTNTVLDRPIADKVFALPK